MGLSRREQEAAWYLAGIIDGEGCVYLKWRSTGGIEKALIDITNTDKSLIEAVEYALEILEINYTIKGPIQKLAKHSPFWKIVIGRREDLRTVYNKVPIQSNSKAQKLEAIVSHPMRCLPRDEWPLEEIDRLYWIENFTARQVGERLGIDHKRVLHYMDKGGIARRTRSEAASLSRVEGRR